MSQKTVKRFHQTETSKTTLSNRDAGHQFNGIGIEESPNALLTAGDRNTIAAIELVSEWEPLAEPSMGDLIELDAETISDDSGVQIVLRKGARGKVMHVDVDGDLEIFFPHLLNGCYYNYPRWFAQRWIMRSQIPKLLKICCPNEHMPYDDQTKQYKA